MAELTEDTRHKISKMFLDFMPTHDENEPVILNLYLCLALTVRNDPIGYLEGQINLQSSREQFMKLLRFKRLRRGFHKRVTTTILRV